MRNIEVKDEISEMEMTETKKRRGKPVASDSETNKADAGALSMVKTTCICT